MLLNGRTHHHHHLFPHTPPTPSIAPDSHFHWHARNQALAAQFWDLGLKPAHPAHGIEQPHPPPPHHHIILHTKPAPSLAPIPISIAHPKPSSSSSVFWQDIYFIKNSSFFYIYYM
jgi:hypothetical protein